MTFTSDGLGICITGASSPPVGALTIPPGVTVISLNAFQSCASVTSLSLPVSLLSIDQFAFAGCTLLGEVTVPPGVVQLQWASFSGCTALTSVSLGAYVITISSQAFYGDSSLASITIAAQTPPTLEVGAFDNLAAGLQIHVPAGRQSVYKAAPVWLNYAAIIQ